MEKEFKAILLTKESWMNSQLSVAKYSGGVQVTVKVVRREPSSS